MQLYSPTLCFVVIVDVCIVRFQRWPVILLLEMTAYYIIILQSKVPNILQSMRRTDKYAVLFTLHWVFSYMVVFTHVQSVCTCVHFHHFWAARGPLRT